MKKTKPKLRVKHYYSGCYVIQELTGNWLFGSWDNVLKPLKYLGKNIPLLFDDYDEACKEAERLLEGDNLQKLKDSLFKKKTTGPTRYFG